METLHICSEFTAFDLSGSASHRGSNALLTSNSRLQTASTCPHRCADMPFVEFELAKVMRLVIRTIAGH